MRPGCRAGRHSGRRRSSAASGRKSFGQLIDDDADMQTGIQIVRRALEEPVRRIAQNAGVDGAVVVGKIEAMKGAKGIQCRYGRV